MGYASTAGEAEFSGFPCTAIVFTNWAMKDFNLHVRMTEGDFTVFREVTAAMGASGVSTAVRFVMREKHRKLGLAPAAVGSKKKRVGSAKPKRSAQ